MRAKPFIFCFVILLTTTRLAAQWIQQNSGVADFLRTVDFPSKDVGYVSMGTNQLLKTVDGGNNWDTITISPANPWVTPYYNAGFPSVDTGYVTASLSFPLRELILKTVDGGVNFDTILTLTSAVGAQSIVDANNAYFLSQYWGYRDTIYKTIDGGLTFDTLFIGIWDDSLSSLYITWTSLFFLNNDTGYAVAEYGKIARTYDGGISWDTLNTGSSANFRNVLFPTAEVGYLMTSNWIIKTTDGGDTWFQLPIPISVSGPGMFFLNADTGYVVFGNEIRKTTDGGFTWSIQPSGIGESLNDIYFVNDSIGYAVGFGGNILKTSNGGEPVAMIEIDETSNEIRMYPNPFRNSTTLEFENKKREQHTLTIYNVTGQLVRKIENITLGKVEIERENLNNGIYFLQLMNRGEPVGSGKLMVQY